MAFFELNDIKRDRIPYSSDFYWHLPWWSPSIQNTPISNLRTTMICAIPAALIIEPLNHIWSSMKTLNLVYEWPRDSKGWSIFMRESFRVPNFLSDLRKKVLFGSLQATFDYGMRLSMLNYFWGGSWSPNCFCDMNLLKYGLLCFTAGFASGMFSIPFQVARKAYFADVTWPAELRKGFRSPLHALFKIPFKEGPLYLFKGGFPIYLGNALLSGWAFSMYTWLKNKTFFLWVYNDIPYNWVKLSNISIAFGVGSIMGYPFYRVKDMMDNWPKERGGRCTFEGSYWNAVKWLRLNYENYTTNLMTGYWAWFRKQGVIFMIAMWIADNYGIFTNNMTDFNTIDNIIGVDESD